MKKLQTEAYFLGGPWSGKYKPVEEGLHLLRIIQGKEIHIYKETYDGDDRVFQWSGVIQP